MHDGGPKEAEKVVGVQAPPAGKLKKNEWGSI